MRRGLCAVRRLPERRVCRHLSGKPVRGEIRDNAFGFVNDVWEYVLHEPATLSVSLGEIESFSSDTESNTTSVMFGIDSINRAFSPYTGSDIVTQADGLG
jgi:hypothetical protein